jgi:hypothetical protein
MLKQATEPLPSPVQFVADLPKAMESLLVKSLARDPNDRFADMRVLIREMEALLASVPTVESPQPERDASYKATLSPAVVSSTADPLLQQNDREAEWIADGRNSVMSDSNSVPALIAQTGAARSMTQTRRPSPVGLFAIVGGVGFFTILGIGVILLLVLPNMLRKPVTPVLTPTFASMVLATETPGQTPQPELGFTLLDPQSVLEMAPDLKGLSELAAESYSTASWNKINALLTFTINSQADVPIVWRWGWCATTDEILQQNMTRIDVIFNADGYVIPQDQLARDTYESTDTELKGWKCQDYLTILRDWKPGTYELKETISFSEPIHDGKDAFEAGSMFREYTVHISP